MKRILPLLLILLLALSACSDSTPAVSGTAAATEPVASPPRYRTGSLPS